MKYVKLFENYQSQKELELLTFNILKKINDLTFSKILNEAISNYQKIKLYDIELSEFVLLKKFLIDFKDLIIHPVHSLEFKKFVPQGASALYFGTKSKENGEINRSILLNISDYILLNTNDLIQEYGVEKAQKKSEEKLILILSSDLLHELQHAYDDWRSKGNFKKYDINNLDLKTYVNTPFEVDARFTEAIKKTKFYREDYEAKFKYDLSIKDIVYEMIPFDEVYKDFLKNLEYTTLLTNEERKRVLRKFGQFYQKEKDYINIHNKEIIK